MKNHQDTSCVKEVRVPENGNEEVLLLRDQSRDTEISKNNML
jgi:hypothetical protein